MWTRGLPRLPLVSGGSRASGRPWHCLHDLLYRGIKPICRGHLRFRLIGTRRRAALRGGTDSLEIIAKTGRGVGGGGDHYWARLCEWLANWSAFAPSAKPRRGGAQTSTAALIEKCVRCLDRQFRRVGSQGINRRLTTVSSTERVLAGWGDQGFPARGEDEKKGKASLAGGRFGPWRTTSGPASAGRTGLETVRAVGFYKAGHREVRSSRTGDSGTKVRKNYSFQKFAKEISAAGLNAPAEVCGYYFEQF